MQKSKKYPYLNAVDSQALLNECEKKGTKDSLSILTQFLHNSKFSNKETQEKALKFIEEVQGHSDERGVLKDESLDLFFKEFFDIPFPEPEKPKFTFIDLFTGMGGFRLAII